MRKKLIVLVVLTALILSACGAASAPSAAPVEVVEAEVAAEAAVAEAPFQTVPGLEAGGDLTSSERLVIKNAALSLVVMDPAGVVERIATLAESQGGFVVSSSVYQASVDTTGNKIMQANITIRVPAAALQAALAQIKQLAVTVNSENVSGEDVTAQYTDLESHLRNLEAAEAQLQQIMDSATKTQDVLDVYNHLVAIRDQIEQVKGQMKYYREAAAMSAISIELIPNALSQPMAIGGWQAEGVVKAAFEALVRSFQGLATLAIWGLVYLLPLGLVFGLFLYVAVRLVQRKFKKAGQAPAG